MKVLQIAASYGQACGIRNFAEGLEIAFARIGVEVHTVSGLSEDLPPSDVTLIHHDWDLYENNDDIVRCLCKNSPQPVVFFAHTGRMDKRSSGAERFSDVVESFVCMCPGVVDTLKPVFLFPHPATIIPDKLEERHILRARCGLPQDSVIIGSSGFLRLEREFPKLLSLLLPHVAANNWFVELATSAWFKSSPELKGIETELDRLTERFPGSFRYGTAFIEPPELNERLQACDLLWCWTNTPSTSYASGSISDQYASGTRLFAVDKKQHDHVLFLPNVVRGPAVLEAFVEGLVEEIHGGVQVRHDPSLLSWDSWAKPFANFLAASRDRSFQRI